MAATHPINTGFLSLLLACRQGGSCSKDQWVTFPISFSQLPIVNTTAVHASAQNSNDTAIADVGTTGFHEYSYNNGYWLAVGH